MTEALDYGQMQLDALREVGNIGAGTAASATMAIVPVALFFVALPATRGVARLRAARASSRPHSEIEVGT